MILLGAGASKPFGIPTMQNFSKKAIDHLKNEGHTEIISEIENSLANFEMTADFESIYAVLEGLKNPIKSIQKSGPLMAYFLKNRIMIEKNYDTEKILSDLRQIIYKECRIENNNFEIIKNCYDNLMNSVKDVKSLGGSRLNNGFINTNMNRVIVTTNYDMSFELYCN